MFIKGSTLWVLPLLLNGREIMKINRLFKMIIMVALALGLFSLGGSYEVEALNGLPEKKFNPEYYNTTAYGSYYDGLNTNLMEESFREELYKIISKDYKPHTYKDNNTTIRYTDVDPDNPNNVIGFYSGKSLQGGWNKEHVWAKSHGFPNSEALPYCDAHHLRPTLNNINSSRGHKDFGELLNESADIYGNKCNNSEIFEPRDEVKGDVARMMFYMATRYGASSGYNLKLVADSTTETSKTNGRFGGLNTLIKWHYEDPVSKEEIYRNNAIYFLFQNNRNPYIDHPEWVDLAYPSEYANVEADEEKALRVIDLINLLPTEITIINKEQVKRAEAAYYNLNYKERKLITNFSILEAAIKTINDLENPIGPNNPDIDNPTTPELDGATTIDFKNYDSKDYSYTKGEKEIIVDNFKMIASRAGQYSGELRIGTNDKKAKVASKFGGNNGVSLLLDFNLTNLEAFSFKASKTYGTIDECSLYLSTDDGASFNKLNYTLPKDGGSVEFSEALNGKLAIVFNGIAPRVVFDRIDLVVNRPKANESFINETASSSIRLQYNNETMELKKAELRLGGLINKSSYSARAKYGVLVLEEAE